MKILFLWTGVTSYMPDGWRRLASEPDVELKIAVENVASGRDFDAARLLDGCDARVVPTGDVRSVREFLGGWTPDLLFAVGWHSKVVRACVTDPAWRNVPKVCCFDMPWRWRLRCLVAPLVLGRFLRRFDAAFVPGAAAARYAKWLGFSRIYPGLFSIDTTRFSPPPPTAGLRPSSYFLYLGRNTPEKRIDDIRRAHARYRARGGKIGLRLYGRGLENGFADPEAVPTLLRNAAAVVLASAFDPWPLVLLEAMAAGRPVIASDKCTNRPELGRNWRVFKTGDVEALARAMADFDRVDAERGVTEDVAWARQYDSREWVKRVARILEAFGQTGRPASAGG